MMVFCCCSTIFVNSAQILNIDSSYENLINPNCNNLVLYFCLSIGSMPTVGSSSMITLGSCNKETPSDTLLHWPPLRKKKLNDV